MGTAITRCPFFLYGRVSPRILVEVMRVDLNADVGESFGPYTIGQDAALMRSITSANIAAGFHGGDPTVLRSTIRLAKAHGVAVGAHPGFPDLAGFGRREMHVTAREAEDLVLYQIAAVGGVAAAEDVPLQHVKPHGALFNLAAKDRKLAAAIASAVAAYDPALILFGLPDSELMTAGRAAGLRVAAEAFADRGYGPDGSLVPRSQSGAVIHDPDVVVSRVVKMVKSGVVQTIEGTLISLHADTICVHGDTPGAADLAARVRSALESAGVIVIAPGHPTE